MNGDDVLKLQKSLNDFGFTEVGESDGWFGPNTEKGVMNFQKFFGFSVNGVVSKDVWECLVNSEGNIIETYIQAVRLANYVRNRLQGTCSRKCGRAAPLFIKKSSIC